MSATAERQTSTPPEAGPSGTKSRPRRESARRKRLRHQVRRNLRHGDWLVQQVKSHNGALARQRDTLEDLGLLKIGRCALFNGAHAAAWGQINRVHNLVAIRPLTQQPSGERLAPKEAAIMKTLPVPVPYEVNGRPACHYKFDGDSFLSVEPHAGSIAINWSTALPIATVLERLGSQVLAHARAGLVFDPSSKRHRQIEPKTLIAELRSGRTAYPFVRLECDELTLVWKEPAWPKHVDEDVRAGRIGVVAPTVDVELVTEMVHATATPLVGESAAELVADAASFVAGSPE